MTTEIKIIRNKIDNAKILLKKSFKDWTQTEKNIHGEEEDEAIKDLKEDLIYLMTKMQYLITEKRQLKELESIRNQTLYLQRNQGFYSKLTVSCDSCASFKRFALF